MVFLGKVLSLLRFELYEFAHNSMQYCTCGDTYKERNYFNLLNIQTLRAICFDKATICIVQLRCSSLNITKKLVDWTCLIDGSILAIACVLCARIR